MRPGRRNQRGFTLIELSIVILIIGLLLGLILVASWSATETARVRATQALITKLEVALNDRLDGLMAQSVTPNGTHRWLAAVNPPGFPAGNPQSPLPWGLTSEQRAQAIARMDQMRAEMPDVFYLQNNDQYPVNFAGVPFPFTSTGHQAYYLPLGNRVGPGFNPTSTPPSPQPGGGYYSLADLNPDGGPDGTSAFNDGQPNLGPGAYVGNPGTPQIEFGGVPDSGIYGASFAVRGAFHRLIGYGPLGVDGVDNNANGLVDEKDEGATGGDPVALQKFLTNHQHDTARAELLYLLLVEGTGANGGIFNKLDFRESEVRDTDNDGIPEFVDAWGRPLQFFRWPVLHPEPGVALGGAPYSSTTEPREVFPLDPGKQLMAPAWWGPSNNDNQLQLPKSVLVQGYFTLLTDLNYANPGAGPPYAALWDLTGSSARRAHGSKFLILSAGPDRDTGLYQLSQVPPDAQGAIALIGSVGLANWPQNVVLGENWAVYRNLYPLTDPTLLQKATGSSLVPFGPPEEALDNITNQGVRNETGGLR